MARRPSPDGNVAPDGEKFKVTHCCIYVTRNVQMVYALMRLEVMLTEERFVYSVSYRQAGTTQNLNILRVSSVKTQLFLISNFRLVLNVVCFLLGNSPETKFYMPTFRNTLSSIFIDG